VFTIQSNHVGLWFELELACKENWKHFSRNIPV